MIVLLIIGILSAAVTLNLTATTYQSFITEATKLSNTFEIISDEAVYTDSVIVCDISKPVPTCESYRDNEWNDVNISKLVAWGWPKDIQITQVRVNGAQLKPNERIRFYPSGENPSMSFEVTDGKYTSWIDGDLNGEYHVSN